MSAGASELPDTHGGLKLFKAATDSGYKGVTRVRGGGYSARLGAATLGIFESAVEAAVAYSRARETEKDELHASRQDQRRGGPKSKRQRQGKGKVMPARPETTGEAASSHYSAGESARYTDRNAETQHQLASRCLELLAPGAPGQLLLDLGCGSGLSSRVLVDAGHTSIGLDVAREMLALAASPPAAAAAPAAAPALVHANLACGLPMRGGASLDGVISVSTLQWLCEPAAGASTSTGTSSSRAALARLFGSLHAALRPGAPAVFQFYPTERQALAAREAAVVAGLADASLLIDLPHASRSRKLFLCARRPAVLEERAAEHAASGKVQGRFRAAEHAAAAAVAAAATSSDEAACCPLAWPHRAACVCSTPWLGAALRPRCMPCRLDGAGCCQLRDRVDDEAAAATTAAAATAASATTCAALPAWVDTFYRSCRCHQASSPAAPPSGGPTAGRVQDAHARHARRLLQRLADSSAAAYTSAAPAAPPPAQRERGGLDATLHLSGLGCGLVMGLRCGGELMHSLLDELSASLLRPLGLSLEHAHLEPDTGALPAAIMGGPRCRHSGFGVQLRPLSVADAAPHAALWLELDAKPPPSAGCRRVHGPAARVLTALRTCIGTMRGQRMEVGAIRLAEAASAPEDGGPWLDVGVALRRAAASGADAPPTGCVASECEERELEAKVYDRCLESLAFSQHPADGPGSLLGFIRGDNIVSTR